jgi:hypothetical protein
MYVTSQTLFTFLFFQVNLIQLSHYSLFSDGNMWRKVMEDPEFLSEVTDVPLDIILPLWYIHIAISSSLPICPIKLQEYCQVYKKNYDRQIHWFPLPPAVCSVLDHAHQIIQILPPTIRSGMLR